MSETKFTPGPYHVHSEYADEVRDRFDRILAQGCGANDAMLFAAAPELYIAANEAIETLESGYSTKEGREILAQDIHHARATLCAALAKAVQS